VKQRYLQPLSVTDGLLSAHGGCQGDTDGNGKLSCSEIAALMSKAQKNYPQLKEHSLYFDCQEASGGISDESWLPYWLQARGRPACWRLHGLQLWEAGCEGAGE